MSLRDVEQKKMLAQPDSNQIILIFYKSVLMI